VKVIVVSITNGSKSCRERDTAHRQDCLADKLTDGAGANDEAFLPGPDTGSLDCSERHGEWFETRELHG
jgi:hypothetical protein